MMWFTKRLKDTKSLDKAFEIVCRTPSDMQSHCRLLRNLASSCGSVLELGVREGVSTVALLSGEPYRMISVDLHQPPSLSDLKRLGGNRWEFVRGNSLDVDVEPCDLVFIDTRHTYKHLKKELGRYSKTAKVMALHDTQTFARVSDFGEGSPGLLDAVDEFVKERKQWRVRQHVKECNGLTVLERG